MTQEFHLSVTPIRDHEYLVRTEHVEPGVRLAEEQVTWYVEDWLTEARLLMADPALSMLRQASSGGLALGDSFGHGDGTRPSSNPKLIALGQKLFNALFQGSIRDSWMMAQGNAQHPHQPQHPHQLLRFRLGLKGDDLHRLPWEVLHVGDRPLASGTDIVFSRYHSSFAVLKSHLAPSKLVPSATPATLKILLVLSEPADQARLALRQEADALRQELQHATPSEAPGLPAIELTILEQPGREELAQALEHNQFQVLHYAGHSDLSANGGSLHLVNRSTGLTETMSGDDLAGLLVNNGVRLTVFNSCRGVYAASAASNTGNLAESLVRRGIPAVLAMAEQIPDNVALHLSRLFYRNLKQGYALDLSLSRARQGLISGYGSDRPYWALPVLYLHPEFDGFLYPHATVSAGSDLTSSPRIAVPTPVSFPQKGYISDLPTFTPEDPSGFFPMSDPVTAEDWEQDWLLDDPDLPEEETVVQRLQEKSHSPTVLELEEPFPPADPSENLLPSPNGSLSGAPSASSGFVGNGRSPAAIPQPSGATAADPAAMYAEMESFLRPIAPLKPAIAAKNNLVRQNPANAEAYRDLGWELYQRGYLLEAAAAYNQAIRLNPQDADAFSRLGLVFLQQGKVDEAVRVYHQAVKLDPTLTEASTNLRNALEDQGHPQPSPPTQPTPQPAPGSPPPPVRPSHARSQRHQRQWLWGGGVAIALLIAIGAWTVRDLGRGNLPTPPSTPSLSPSPQSELSRLDSKTLAQLATTQLQQNQLQPAAATLTALLTKPADAAIQAEWNKLWAAVPDNVTNDPAIAFLKGRSIWQRWVTGDKTADLKTVRQLWEQASQETPTTEKYNALGFLYYALGQPDRAEEAWFTALRLAGNSDPTSMEQLTTRAGLALAFAKRATLQADPAQQANLRAEAQKSYQLVKAGDRTGSFEPSQLAGQWMWTETAIADWQALSTSASPPP